MNKSIENLDKRVTCIEKRQAVKTGSKWDFMRMIAVEADVYQNKIAVGNLKAFITFRALQIKAELEMGCSWKTFFKKLWCKILGKSLAWELACKEVVRALRHKVTFLKSEDGWASNFDKNMADLLKQPW